MVKNKIVILNGEKHEMLATKKELKFWDFIGQGFSKKDSYIKAYPNSDPKYATTYASRIFKKEKFEPIKENLWKQYQDDAGDAYVIQKEIMKAKKTDPELKNKIADKIQDRAGYSPILKIAQLKINTNAGNPLLDKSEKELRLLAERTTEELGKIRKEITKLNIGKDQEEIIEGEVFENEGE